VEFFAQRQRAAEAETVPPVTADARERADALEALLERVIAQCCAVWFLPTHNRRP
jgi:hypothetical protein